MEIDDYSVRGAGLSLKLSYSLLQIVNIALHGGVGPMTIACLLRNTVLAACAQKGIKAPELY